MLFLWIFLFSFIFFFNSFSFKPPPPMKSEWRLLLSPLFWEELSRFLLSWFHKNWLSIGVHQVPMKMPLKKINLGLKPAEYVEEESPSLLDLPELTLESILERLSPSGLCSMAGVCSALRDRCTSDHLWKRHLKQKWGGLIGDAAFKEWQCHIASSKRPSLVDQRNHKNFFKSLGTVWSFSWIKPKFETRNHPRTALPVDSIMAMYLSLESGKFWFPAQVYNREVICCTIAVLIILLFTIMILFLAFFSYITLPLSEKLMGSCIFGCRMDMLGFCSPVMMLK